MKWIVPPECQGQIVEVSYAQVVGTVYRRVYDRSDRSESYYRAEAAADDEGDYQNGEPRIANSKWKRCDDPDPRD